jgi:hypothetical protein
MLPLSPPLRFLLVALAGWINQQQRDVIDYLREENRVLREQLGHRRVRFLARAKRFKVFRVFGDEPHAPRRDSTEKLNRS